MLDAALIKECADPSLKPAIVEQFVDAVGSPDPLAVSMKSGGRLILIPKAKTADEVMEIIRQNVGHAVVRVGLTQFPAGVGAKDASELKPDLVEPCANLRMGTAMFAKILRIVIKWYGNPKSEEVFPQIFDDAVYAWKTGEFEGNSVFQAEDPGGAVAMQSGSAVERDVQKMADQPGESAASSQSTLQDAGIRIDLSRIGGQR
ncbi:TraH family protein [Rhizobium mesosinicum]|uniref:Conjugal transfer protein TraH n=1 Tax=Rhizobium mesosinicum TaxID=335017 RepID=A0ABS7GX78_9HYPH|nr:TraH family protein [Rhizobium mesosinicum]MBW9054577.1 conjugal transfer protein TraH [Rhizobium mesosinicum]